MYKVYGNGKVWRVVVCNQKIRIPVHCCKWSMVNTKKKKSSCMPGEQQLQSNLSMIRLKGSVIAAFWFFGMYQVFI